MCGEEKKKKVYVRSGIRTHAYKSRLRPERSALDRSAILTARSLLPTSMYLFSTPQLWIPVELGDCFYQDGQVAYSH